ncbi:PQQ-like beta-propeller repeat protein [bacterium]|nr:PQQ-like beta-propeller repeat protein [bacterium]
MAVAQNSTAATPEKDWPTFRGPSRTAVSSDQDLLEKWSEDGPKLLWETDGLGRGYSSLAIADGKIYTMGDSIDGGDGTDEYLLSFDQKTGEQLWKLKTGPGWMNGNEAWQSSRSTPTVDGDRVYVLTAHGKLICANIEGEEIWSKNLKEDFQGKKADGWGYSESVLIDGEKLVVTPGGTKNTMVALEKMTGETIWTTIRDNDRGAGHASTLITNIGGTKVYVTTTGSGAMGVRARDGKLLWSYEIDKTTAVIPTPIVRNDLVFFAAGYKRGGALLKQVPSQAEGEVTIEEIYPINPDLANKHGGILLIGDHLYGDSDDKGIPFCADLMTGKVLWKGRSQKGRKSASIVAADGHVYFRFSNGFLALVEATPEEYNEVSIFEVPGSGERPSWSHPVITGGKLYLREGSKLLCYDLQG